MIKILPKAAKVFFGSLTAGPDARLTKFKMSFSDLDPSKSMARPKIGVQKLHQNAFKMVNDDIFIQKNIIHHCEKI